MSGRIPQRLVPTSLLAIALALGADEPPPLPNKLKPTADASSWRFEQHGDAKGSINATKDELVLDVSVIDDTPWHVQCFQTTLDLQNDAEHTLKFKAKADAAARKV